MTRHALTTDTLDLNRREEMARRNLDSISYLFHRRLEHFIGRTNAVPSNLARITYEVNKVLKYLKVNQFTTDLGGQLVDGAIRLNANGSPMVSLNPLAADHVDIVVDLLLPYATNYISLYLSV